jgi:hypothetical protein
MDRRLFLSGLAAQDTADVQVTRDAWPTVFVAVCIIFCALNATQHTFREIHK